MSIQDRNLKPGTVLVARYKKQDHRCEVVKGEDGRAAYRLEDGREFASPSAAGSAVMGGVACNGWRFWSLEGDLPAPKATSAPTAAKKAPAKAKAAGKAKGTGKGAAKAKRTPKAEKNSALPAKPIACGHCGQEFPDGRAAAEHMKAEHGAPEAPGTGGAR